MVSTYLPDPMNNEHDIFFDQRTSGWEGTFGKLSKRSAEPSHPARLRTLPVQVHVLASQWISMDMDAGSSPVPGCWLVTTRMMMIFFGVGDSYKL